MQLVPPRGITSMANAFPSSLNIYKADIQTQHCRLPCFARSVFLSAFAAYLVLFAPPVDQGDATALAGLCVPELC